MRTKTSELDKSELDIVKHLQKQIRLLERDRAKLHEKLGNLDEFAARCAAAIVAAPPFPRFTYKHARAQGVEVVANIDFSDWHIGEVIRANETDGFNRYNYRIAEARIFGIVNDFLKWVDVQRRVYVIQECRITGKGDYISGDIHYELSATNEFPVPEQTVRAGKLLGEVIRRIASHFERVQVDAVGADNHGRLTRKPQAKQKTSNNMSFIVHEMARVETGACRNVKWNIATGMKLLTRLAGWPFLIEHGDTIKSWAGFPYYGLGRLIGREATRRMTTGKGFQYLSIGHFHVPAFVEGRTLVNGSLSGTSEFDHSCGRHAAPSQLAFLVHPKHGVFNLVAFRGEPEV